MTCGSGDVSIRDVGVLFDLSLFVLSSKLSE
jgi:hypothetical protein